ENIRETASLLAGKKRLEFSTEGEDREIFLDTEIISRCSENVFTNALRYAKESVTVRVALEGDMLFVSVEDDGAGFSQAALAGATNPFFKESSGGEHLGLGLNICHLLTQSHGGSVRLENTGRGAKVTLSFNVGIN
ncbi:MAG: sensor histidine kinase, partial [Christensenellaceae bacterium]